MPRTPRAPARRSPLISPCRTTRPLSHTRPEHQRQRPAPSVSVDKITDVSRPFEIAPDSKRQIDPATSAEEPRKRLNGGKADLRRLAATQHGQSRFVSRPGPLAADAFMTRSRRLGAAHYSEFRAISDGRAASTRRQSLVEW